MMATRTQILAITAPAQPSSTLEDPQTGAAQTAPADCPRRRAPRPKESTM